MNDKKNRKSAKKIIARKKDAGQRLDLFLMGAKSLAKLLAKNNISRHSLQALIKQGDITVNYKIAKPHYYIKADDVIAINKTALAARGKQLKAPSSEFIGTFPEIIAETGEYLVINKPAGLTAHNSTSGQATLADLVHKKFPALAKVGDDPSRPGIVHRLDKDVSGLMVIAKTPDSFNNLKKQFQSRAITKEYTVLVYGQINQPDGLIDFPIKRSEHGFKMAALPLTDKGELNTLGKQAVTQFTVIKNYINHTLLKAVIKTGRTHQIRVHFAALDHPAVGDNIYATARTRAQNKKLKLTRIFLVADKLAFNDLHGQRQEYRIELPEELKIFLEKLK